MVENCSLDGCHVMGLVLLLVPACERTNGRFCGCENGSPGVWTGVWTIVLLWDLFSFMCGRLCGFFRHGSGSSRVRTIVMMGRFFRRAGNGPPGIRTVVMVWKRL